MKFLRFIMKLLLVVGALNWGLVGFFQYDLVADLFGGMNSMAARAVYSLVGIAGVFGLVGLFCCCKSKCSSGCNCAGKCNEDCKCSKCGPGCHCGCRKDS